MNGCITITQHQPGIIILGLNRPEQRNALNVELLDALEKTVRALSEEAKQRVLILKGAGPVFCAGLDLKEASDSSRAHLMAEEVADTIKTLYLCPFVTIAAVQGAAIAGGAGLIAACDLVVAAEDAQIGYPETRRGLVAALVMTLLRRQVGDRHARELLLTGELISAQRAAAIGLINRAVPSQKLMEECLTLATNVLKGGPEATTLSKTLLDELQATRLENDIDQALAFHHQARAGREAEEGIRAFLEKREPVW